ncbi:hypothetical protein [Actinoallomurus rhizosphaericola]|uniref:hypothetical protein n=1 Tax=Actinoallomurus rhizosphaericola TaxID=2952536 RepID=UPI002090F14E|nr:hypothetical protein [Actinoallomurus rhizosphaericola]MCO5991835.1 hypothetical protein [Actinoallomurus rhizosphaericola]
MSSGLQAQRTELTWLRALLSSWAAGLLAVKIAFPAGAVALLGPLAVTAVAYRRRRWLRGHAEPPPMSPVEGLLLAGACVWVAIAGVLML